MAALSLGVCVLLPPCMHRGRTVNYPRYVHEILAHAGLAYETLSTEELERNLPHLKVLVTVGDETLDESTGISLRRWVEAGGAWLSIGGLCGLEDLLGATRLPPAMKWGRLSIRSLGEGYLQRRSPHKALQFADKPLHFFGGLSVRATDGEILAVALDQHGREDGSPAMLERRAGRGRTMLIAVDVTGTIVRVQQGISVTRDGVPSRDGLLPLDELCLKSDDGCVLDASFDRHEVPGSQGLSVFLRPVADEWREILLRSIFHLAETTGAPLPLLWMYPRGLPAIGHVSHDTDGNEPEKAQMLLASLARAGIHSTWCVIAPGYPSGTIEAIRAAGHELAMHYDAMTPERPWGEAHFDRQWRELCAVLGRRPVTNKNHYLRWEGDTEFYAWLETRGVELDQTKGPSKVGGVGFNFGTCHPYFPVHFNGNAANVLELPTHTQDLTVHAPEEVGLPLLEAALRHHGVAHFLFHPAHFAREATPRAMEKIVAEGTDRGMEWWTAEQLNTWERARRTVRWSSHPGEAAEATLTLANEVAISDATLLWLGQGPARVMISGRQIETATVTRWGFAFQAAVLDIAPGKAHEVSFRLD